MPSIDLQKHIAYWRDGAQKDLLFAHKLLFRENEVLYGLFFTHFALEKMIKAHVCRHTQQVPPRTHQLVTLAKLAGLSLAPEDVDFLARINLYNLEGRYPSPNFPAPKISTAQAYFFKAKEITEWLAQKL